MKEISLNILDIAENSTRAGATLVQITVEEDTAADTLSVTIEDNGSGMSPEFLAQVQDPFVTSRTTRRVGLGIPLIKEAAEATGGSFSIDSQLGRGTVTRAVFGYRHIDRMPLGDMAGTISTLIQCHEKETDFIYRHRYNGRSFDLDTRQLRQTLENVPLSEPAVVFWIRDYVNEHLQEIYGG